MPVPWLRVLNAAIGISSIVRGATQQRAPRDERLDPPSAGVGGSLEAGFAGVMVSALKEAFDRDRQRLDVEREHIEAERQRAERLLRLDLLRQAGDREIGRLRLTAGVAVVCWLATVWLAASLETVAARALLGVGWLLLLVAIGLAFEGQSRVIRALDRIAEAGGRTTTGTFSSGAPGSAAIWLVLLGLAMSGVAVLVG